MKKFLLILLTVLLGFNSLKLSAQESLTVANGSVTNSYVPFYGLWMDALTHSQVIYPASMLTNLNGASIMSMTFYLSNSPSAWGCPFNIQLGETTQENYGSSASYITSGLSSVYTGQVTIANNQLTITFTTPFTYTGTNLVLDVQNTTTGSFSSAYFYGESTSSSQGCYAYGSNSPTGQSFIPKTTFSYVLETDCHAPATISVNNIDATGAEISWADSDDSNNYIIQYKTSSQSWDNAVSDAVSGTTYDLTGLLNSATNYDVRVATDCGTDTSYWKSISFITSLVPEELPYTATFDENDGWLLNNGSASNYWIKDTTNNLSALFITNDGSTPGYDISSSSTASAEKHIVVGEATTIFVSFDLQCGGEGTSIPYDYLKVFLAPMDVDYASNTSWNVNSYSTYAANFSSYSSLPSYPYLIHLLTGTVHIDLIMTNPIQEPDATSMAKLVFGWKNDNSTGTQPGPIITNLHVGVPSCDRPSQPTVSNITAFTANVAWEAPSDDANDFFVQYVPANLDWDAPDAIFENVSGTSLQLADLEPSTNYQLRVATNCFGDTSLWRTVTFTTPATCYPPVNVIINQITGTSALVSWEEAFYGANNYTVAHSEAGQENWTEETVDAIQFMLSGLQPNTEYDVMVYSNCDIGTADTIERNFTTHCLSGGDPFTGDSIPTYYIPVNNYYGYTYSQQIFLASEMGGASTIDSIAFEYGSANASTLKTNVVIYLGHTSQSTFSSSSNYIPLSDLTQVYSGNLNCQQGWNTFVLSTPFQYNGTDNLVLAVDDNSGDYDGSSYTFLAHNAGANRTLHFYNDYNDPNPSNPTSSGATSDISTDRSNVKFFIPCDNTTTCVAPNAYVNEVSTSSITVNWVAGSTETSWEMEYQSATDADWTNVGSVTSPYELTDLDANTVYNIHIRSNCDGGNHSNWTSLSVRTECGMITSLPFTENFDTYGTGNNAYPLCWDRNNNNSSLTPYIYNGGYQSSTGSLYFYAGNGVYNMAITPEFDANIELNTLQATFMYKATYSQDRLLVGVISDPEDASTFVAIDTVYPDPTSVSTWVEKEVNFSEYTGTDAHYIAFKNEYVSNYAYAYIDNLVINTITTCQKPSALTVSDIDLTSATLSWTEGDAETEWDIEYGPVGFTHGNGTIEHAYGIPYDLTDLTANTSYDVYVRSDCGGGEVSDWILTPVHFTTLICNAEDQCEYTVIMGDGYGDGWNGAYMTVIQEGTTVATLEAINHQLMDTQTYDTIHLNLCADMPTQVTWNSGNFDSEISLYFYGPDGAALISLEDLSSASDILDTFTTNCSGCFAPRNLSAIPSSDAISATISWTIGAEESSWILEYKAASDSIWTTENISGTPGSEINGLTPSTLYNVRVKSDCGNGESSFITISFRTPCLITVVTDNIPFSEDFNTLTSGIPDCWDNSEGTTTNDSYKWNYYSSGESGAGLRFNSYFNSNGNTNKLKTPALDLTAVTTPMVSFSYKNPTGGDFSVFLSTDGGYTDTTVIATGLTNASTWTDVEYVLPNMTDADNVVIVFKGTSNYGGGDAYIYLDNVFVGTAPTCPRPTQLTATAATTTSITLSWTPGDEETEWEILYGAPGFDPATEGTPVQGVTTNPYTVTGLTPSTMYEFYVSAVCSSTDHSYLSQSTTYATDCEAITAPYSENFDNYTTLSASAVTPDNYPNVDMPLCWSFLNRSTSNSSYPQAFLSSYSYYAVSGNCLFFKSSSSTPLFAILPEFTNSIQSLMLRFTYRNEGVSAYNGTLSVGYMTNPADTSSFVEVATFAQTSTLTEDSVSFNTVPASVTDANIVFKYTGGSSNNYYLSIDNVTVEEVGAPVITDPTVTTNAASAIAQTTATLNATINNPSSVNITACGFEWKAYSDANYTIVTLPSVATTMTHNLTNLIANTTYTYRAFITFNGTTVRGDDETFTTQNGGGETCNVPTNLTATATAYNTANVTWTAGGTETAWNLRYRTGAANWTTVATTTTSYQLTGLSAQTPYEVQVQAVCSNTSSSDWTASVSFTTPAEPVEPCDAPTNLTFNDLTATSVTVTWTAVGNATTWKVQYKQQGTSQYQEATVQTTSYDMEGLTANTTYDVQVKAICDDGSESELLSGTVTTQPVGIDNITLANSINLMPNPADNYIELTINGNVAVKEAVVYNAFGQMIQTVELNDNHARIDLSDMAAGMYFVRVNGEGAMATKKFIKR